MRTFHTESQSHHEPDPYDELAIGIIRQAAEDYRRLGKKLRYSNEKSERKEIENAMGIIRNFFISDWFSVLSGLENGCSILEKLDEEVFDSND